MLHYLSYPCIVRCLHTVVILTVCMDKLVSHMIKQSTQESESLSNKCVIVNGMTDHQYFHEIVNILLLIQQTSTEYQKHSLVHVKMICT